VRFAKGVVRNSNTPSALIRQAPRALKARAGGVVATTTTAADASNPKRQQ